MKSAESKHPHILAAFPTYDGSRVNGEAIFSLAKSPYRVSFIEIASSLLAKTFNTALGYALIERQKDVTHLLLMHADIKPLDKNWFDIFFKEMQSVGADILSAIVPIKDDRGLTSTAKEMPNKWEPQRYTMHEIMEMPETWTAPDLLFNTGMLLLDVHAPWFDKCWFTINDEIYLEKETNTYRIHVEPEDWYYSRQVRKLGAKPYVTRKVRIHHGGKLNFANYAAWGSLKTDKKG